MREFRETIIKDILNSTDEIEVRMVIVNAIQKLKLNGTHPFIILRFIAKLTSVFNDLKSEKLGLKEKNITSEALIILEGLEIKNTANIKRES